MFLRTRGMMSVVAAVALPDDEEQLWLGKFGERWFNTVCMVAGCSPSRPDPDRTGADFLVQDHAHETIRVQVKTTAVPDEAEGAFRFSLDIRTYDLLRQGNTPGYLVVVVVLDPHPRWIGLCRKGSIVRAAMYWTCLTGLAPVSNTSTITLSLPLGNMLTPEALLGFFPKGGDTHGNSG
jgi:hypothetical protein